MVHMVAQVITKVMTTRFKERAKKSYEKLHFKTPQSFINGMVTFKMVTATYIIDIITNKTYI